MALAHQNTVYSKVEPKINLFYKTGFSGGRQLPLIVDFPDLLEYRPTCTMQSKYRKPY